MVAFGLRVVELDASMGTWVAMVANGMPIFSSDSDPDPGYSNKWRQAIVFLSVSIMRLCSNGKVNNE